MRNALTLEHDVEAALPLIASETEELAERVGEDVRASDSERYVVTAEMDELSFKEYSLSDNLSDAQ